MWHYSLMVFFNTLSKNTCPTLLPINIVLVKTFWLFVMHFTSTTYIFARGGKRHQIECIASRKTPPNLVQPDRLHSSSDLFIDWMKLNTISENILSISFHLLNMVAEDLRNLWSWTKSSTKLDDFHRNS